MNLPLVIVRDAARRQLKQQYFACPKCGTEVSKQIRGRCCVAYRWALTDTLVAQLFRKAIR